jgi:ribonuclease Z
MLELTFLGTAAAVPTTKRNLPSLAVRANGDVILFDCGEGTQRELMKNKISYAKVKVILISHLHLDHFLGIFGLGETLRLSGVVDKIDVFGPKGTQKFLSSFGKREIFNIHELPTRIPSGGKEIFKLGNYSILAFKVDHKPKMDAYGFRINEDAKLRFKDKLAKSLGITGPKFKEIEQKKSITIGKRTIKLEDVTYLQQGKSICYSGDTLYCESLVQACKDTDLLIHECTFDDSKKTDALERYHSTVSDATSAAKRCGAKHLILTHISGRYDENGTQLLEKAKQQFKNTSVAKDGKKIILK